MAVNYKKMWTGKGFENVRLSEIAAKVSQGYSEVSPSGYQYHMLKKNPMGLDEVFDSNAGIVKKVLTGATVRVIPRRK